MQRTPIRNHDEETPSDILNGVLAKMPEERKEKITKFLHGSESEAIRYFDNPDKAKTSLYFKENLKRENKRND
jgi:hypothetical protein